MTHTPAEVTMAREGEPNVQKYLPPWAVVLHADVYAPMSYVVTCLLNCVPGLSVERATEITEEAHQQGQARVVTCPLELAELYQERLQDLVLTATIERA
jgi:ATP-dependent Clp protease adaptor protein ClpS